MVLVQNSPFFYLFILRQFPSLKIEIFPKGFVPGDGPKLAIFLSFYSETIEAMEMCCKIS